MNQENIEKVESTTEKVEEECTIDEAVENTECVLNSLIDLLIEKKIITEEEFQKKLDEE